MKNLFDLTDKIVLITGAGGLLGPKHAEAVIEYGATAIITDHHEDRAIQRSKELNEKYGDKKSVAYKMDVTNKAEVQDVVNNIIQEYGKIDILINNAAKDPKVKKGDENLTPASRFETMTEDYWKEGLDAALNGTFFCSQIVGNEMKKVGKGNIINISSDLGVISPDQRLYRKDGVDMDSQNVKPITYSAAKWAIVGMTKYLGTYFQQQGVDIRVNALSPTGVFNDHPEDFVKKLSNIIPAGRMAHIDEYKAAIVFLCSDANSYMTGENLVIDGGKSVV